MAILSDILENIKITARHGSDELSINDIRFDSRLVVKNDLFVAIRGTRTDGHSFVPQAIANGASAIICERLPVPTPSDVTFIEVKSSDAALGIAASNFFGTPSRQLLLVGVTGTNGKTTTATSLFHLFQHLGYKAGLLSTVRNQIDHKIVEATHTTPDAVQINRLIRQMVNAGCEYCFMEVSSHALTQYRTSGLQFRGGIFTNLSQDHLDYHETFDEYLRAKKLFFDRLPSSAFALVNGDDPYGKEMLDDCESRKFTFGIKTPSDFNCKVLEGHFDGMLLKIDGTTIGTRLIGEFNASNLLAVYSTAVLLGQEKEQVLSSIGSLGHVAGRFECVRSGQGILAIIDYAHTPDALKNVLETIKQIRSGRERVITVIGAGGDRDKTKRPLMAQIAVRFSDRVVLTSDNPRSEQPARIIDDMQKGVASRDQERVTPITDRKEGIRRALQLAGRGDIVLIAGKGHETYQEIKGVRHHFDDMEVVMELFRKMR